MNFEGWLESKGYMEGYEHDYQDAYDEGFDEGQQSQQDKIDEVNEKHSEEKRILHNVIEMNQAKIDELQARFDGALKIIDGVRHNGAIKL